MNIGLFFGSFNPIHRGHLAVAKYMLAHAGLDQVWFVVTPHNPFKEKAGLLNDKQRLLMVKEATRNESRFRASDIEFKLPRPSYTVRTLKALRKKFPRHRFSLIMGTDNLAEFHRWKDHEGILQHHRIFIYPRKGSKPGVYAKHPQVVLTRAPGIVFSSTAVRHALKEGKSVAGLLPPAVYRYIRAKGFYR